MEGSLKLKTVNSGLVFQEDLNIGKVTQQAIKTHIITMGDLALVFMGEIHDIKTLSSDFESRAHVFEGECDGEYLVRLIDEIQINEVLSLHDSVRVALDQVKGAYSVLVMSKNTPSNIVAGNTNQNTLAIGLGENEYYIGNDISSLHGRTDKVIYLGENKVAAMSCGGNVSIKTLLNEPIKPIIQRLECSFNPKKVADVEEKKSLSLNYMANLLGVRERRKSPTGFLDLIAFRLSELLLVSTPKNSFL